ncbi:MAG: BofC C-terminal domain-containing protein [Kyrpidia sp.]|nr:BofC C-terminal domain-containing protein [Kyrpidia sp.]
MRKTRRLAIRVFGAAIPVLMMAGFSAGSAHAASSLYLPGFGAFAPGQQALFVTEYAGGLVRIHQGVVDDVTEPAFAAPGARWALDGGLTVVSNVPVFRRSVADMPLDAKGHLFFGLNRESHLVLYDGEPGAGREVRDFGRLDASGAAKALPKGTLDGLRQGLRVDSRDDYLSILSTYGEYLE